MRHDELQDAERSREARNHGEVYLRAESLHFVLLQRPRAVDILR